jgi:pimeloyl-ACP methyl ester carboxylesterase
VSPDSAPLPPILLIHGVASSFEHNWQSTGWVDLLEGEGREVIPVDLPGHGRAATRGDENTTELILAAISAYPQVDAVGFSAGGHALLAVATRYPERFRKLAVLGVGSLEPGNDGDQHLGDDIVNGLEADTEPESQVPRLIRRLVESAGNDPRLVATFMRTPHDRALLADLAVITAPALVIIGEKDFTGTAVEVAAALPSARLLTLKGVDHFATPSDFACMDAVLTFISE